MGSVWLFGWKIKKAFINFMNAFLVRLAERTGYEPSLSLALSSVTSISQFCLSHFNGVWFGVLYRVDIGFMLFAFVLYLTLDTNTRKWLKNECNGLKNPAQNIESMFIMSLLAPWHEGIYLCVDQYVSNHSKIWFSACQYVLSERDFPFAPSYQNWHIKLVLLCIWWIWWHYFYLTDRIILMQHVFILDHLSETCDTDTIFLRLADLCKSI